MITLTRRQAQSLRAVFRRAALGITHRGALPPLALEAQGSQLCPKYRYEALTVSRVLPGDFGPPETILLPLDALADCEGKADTPVVLEAAAPDRTVVRWEDRHVPQTHEYAVPALDTLPAFPEQPTSWTEAPAVLLDALTEAADTCTDSDTRYALASLLLRGGTGEIIATDGHQLLVQRGYRFPWDGDVLVKRTPLFGSSAFPRHEPVALGKTETHVALRTGEWTLLLEIRKDVRYPDVSRIMSESGPAATRLQIDPEDAAFLVEALDGLPSADATFRPLTMDLNGRVTVRARGGEPEQTTELVLNRSRYSGYPVRLNGNRTFLARALRLGFRELEIENNESPIAARDARRLYMWHPLNHESAIEPTDDVTRIESCPEAPRTATRPERRARERTAMNERTQSSRNGTRTHAALASETSSPATASNSNTNSTTDGARAADDTGPKGLTALIQEAESLHEVLGDAKARTARLIVALRRQKKRERLVASTLTALKELKLQEVTD